VTSHLDRPRSDDVRHPPRWLLYGGQWFGRFVIRRYYDVHVHHPERFPASGPVVVAGNHVGFADGPFMALLLPRPVHAWTKLEMYRGPLGWFLDRVGQIRLDRFHTDPLAVRTALRVLRDGHAVGVFPEGRRGAGELETFHRGAAYLAMVTGAPVVPVTFLGTRLPGGRSGSIPPRGARIDIVIGNPVPMQAVEWPRGKQHVTAASLRLHDQMRAGLAAALAETGRTLPGPLPAGDIEPDPADDVMKERGA
jgi:1-acyl-sn-glycerol-3-phosphate acyltransferase